MSGCISAQSRRSTSSPEPKLTTAYSTCGREKGGPRCSHGRVVCQDIPDRWSTTSSVTLEGWRGGWVVSRFRCICFYRREYRRWPAANRSQLADWGTDARTPMVHQDAPTWYTPAGFRAQSGVAPPDNHGIAGWTATRNEGRVL